MIASLPMYDHTETVLQNDYSGPQLGSYWFWTRSINTYRKSLSFWKNENLVLGQTCGLPYRKCLFDKVHYVALPDYSLNACLEGYYKNVFISYKKKGLAEASEGIFAFNEPLSQSGWAAPMYYLEAPDLCPNAVCKTVSHANSAHAIVENAQISQ